MKMAKASDKDIDAAGNAMGILQDIASGYYPAHRDEDDAPHYFDPDDKEHLRRFYERMAATLDAAPGWPGRVIGGMCYVIMYDANRIIDPDADTVEVHPRFAATLVALQNLANAFHEGRAVASESSTGYVNSLVKAAEAVIAQAKP